MFYTVWILLEIFLSLCRWQNVDFQRVVQIFSSLNSLEMPIGHYGLYRVGLLSIAWSGCESLAKRCSESDVWRYLPDSSLFYKVCSNWEHFCDGSIHEVIPVERGKIFLDTCKGHLSYMFGLSQHNKMILSINRTAIICRSVSVLLREALQSWPHFHLDWNYSRHS